MYVRFIEMCHVRSDLLRVCGGNHGAHTQTFTVDEPWRAKWHATVIVRASTFQYDVLSVEFPAYSLSELQTWTAAELLGDSTGTALRYVNTSYYVYRVR